MKDLVSFSDFMKLDLRVGEIVDAVVPDGSEKLIKMSVDFGEAGKRIIFAGIREWYGPDELVGKRCLFVFNMKPKKTPFGDSEGMLLAIDADDDNVLIIEVPDTVSPGAVAR